MRCIRPLKASIDNTGSITFKQKESIKGLIGFELECRKCLPCRLNIAREKAIRAVHEAKLHGDKNIFLTLTYNEQSLKSPKLQYIDFELFMKSLREKISRGITDPELKKQLKISFMVTGEYGEKNKRPHWHACIFNYRPTDEKPHYITERGEQVYTSQELTNLWKKGNVEYGSLTMDSAGYVARYAAKKLVHGNDQDHEYHPIHQTSKGRAIGRTWIEKYHEHTFAHGYVILPNGSLAKIPRYYQDWCKKHKPDLYIKYITGKKQEIIKLSEEKHKKEEMEYISECINNKYGPRPITRSQMETIILNQKFKQLQEKLKL